MKDLGNSELTLPLIAVPTLVVIAGIYFIWRCWAYRKALLDTNETPWLLMSKCIARVLGVRVVQNTEYVLYRATLSVYELARLKIDLRGPIKLLIHLEDKEFYAHSGVSAKGLVRLLMAVLRVGRWSGGSTITQQLVRSLFIQDRGHLYRRKIVELIAARWLNRVIPKKLQLEMYFSAVRFDRGVLGIVAGMQHFLGEVKPRLSPGESFFLIERISNIRARLMPEKVDQMLCGAVASGLMERGDVQRVIELYATAIERGQIIDAGKASLDKLKRAWPAVIE